MSKGNLFLGFGRGKVGDVVFYRSNGEQITRSLNRNPKNPRSESQLLQRIIMGTVMQAYSKMKSITDHSFEGVQPGAATMAEFLRLNVDNLRARVSAEIEQGSGLEDIYAFTPMGTAQFAPNEYIVSRGTLPMVPCQIETTTSKITGISENTYQAIIDAYGLQRGDQLTFLWSQGTTPARTEFYFCRVILDPRNPDGTEAPLSSMFVGQDNTVYLPNPRNEGQFGTLTFSNSEIHFGFNQQLITSAGIIVSRKVNSSWLRSSCTLGWATINVAMSWPSIGECIALVNEGDITTVGQRYLNNAGRGRTAAQGTGVTPFSTTNKAGTAVTLVGLTYKPGRMWDWEGVPQESEKTYYDLDAIPVLVDNNGNEYYIENTSMTSKYYGMYAGKNAPAGQDVWRNGCDDATNANTIQTGDYDGADSLWSWMFAQGLTPEIMNDYG